MMNAWNLCDLRLFCVGRIDFVLRKKLGEGSVGVVCRVSLAKSPPLRYILDKDLILFRSSVFVYVIPFFFAFFSLFCGLHV